MVHCLLVGTWLASAADPADRLAAAIDRHLAADWAARKIEPARPADDAEFARRICLDLIGRIPRVSESRAFLADPATDKRAKLIDALLSSPAHANHFAAVARAAWIPATAGPERGAADRQLEAWLRAQCRANVPADAVVRKLLSVALPAPAGGRPAARRRVEVEEGAALLAFYRANGGKPETVAAAASRLFLGVKLECAQCHDHPFHAYTRDRFWTFAAFFADVSPLPLGVIVPDEAPAAPPGPHSLRIPNTDRTVEAAFFDGGRPKWTVGRSPRQELAEWLTRPENPFLARNLANRAWAQFFGLGLVDPVDEPGENNPPSHPELLRELAMALAAAKFDNRLLYRAIARSRAYQLTSRQTHLSQADPRRFARMAVRGLTPAQIYDSLVVATGHRDDAVARPQRFRRQPANAREEFLARFAGSDRPTETQTSIPQALMLMNGEFVDCQTGLKEGEVLAAVADAPFWTADEKVEALFLAALARKPTPEEAERFGSYAARGGPSGDGAQALSDAFWVLLNSTEFLFQH